MSKTNGASDSKQFADQAGEALREAVADALQRHKSLGESVAVDKDGQVVIIPAAQIPERSS